MYMKKLLLLLFITAAITFSLKAQDTLYTRNGKPVICVVTEIGIDEIKYKDYENPDGPVYVIRKVDVLRITYKNGKTEYIVPDEMAMNKEEEIVDKNQCIKVAFLSPLFNHIELVYERKLKMTKNLELNLGFIGIGNKAYRWYDYSHPYGAYISSGIKFLTGKDYYVKGMKYAHPLKGTYLKPMVFFSFLEYYDTKYISGNQYVQTKYRASLTSLNIVFGKQNIVGNSMTFDFHLGVGMGYACNWEKGGYRTTGYLHQGNFGGSIFISDEFPMTVTCGLLIGFVFK